MDKNRFKAEVITEVEKLIRAENTKYDRVSGPDKLKAMAERLGKTKQFGESITKTVNSLLAKHKVTFKDNREKEAFFNFLQPTINALMTRLITR